MRLNLNECIMRCFLIVCKCYCIYEQFLINILPISSGGKYIYTSAVLKFNVEVLYLSITIFYTPERMLWLRLKEHVALGSNNY